MLVLIHELVQCEFGSMVQQLLVDVVDDELASDGLLEQVYLVYDLLRHVLISMLYCVLHALQDCPEYDVGVCHQLARYLLAAFSKQVGEEGNGGIRQLIGVHQFQQMPTQGIARWRGRIQPQIDFIVEFLLDVRDLTNLRFHSLHLALPGSHFYPRFILGAGRRPALHALCGRSFPWN